MNPLDLASSAFFNPVDKDKAHSVFKRVRMMPLYRFPCLKEYNLGIKEHSNRFFLHLDLDAFYAQVEQRDNPNYKGKPVGVVSLPDTFTKGIVMTSSYEARALGVDTAMTTYQAKTICPQLILVPCYGQKYEAILFNILTFAKKYVPDEAIEQYSIDECFIDLTSVCKDFKSAEKISREFKDFILKEEDLTCSMGLSFNKSYAKMATKLHKPAGFTLITQRDRGIFFPMAVDKIWGIGNKIKPRLNFHDVWTIQDLANCPDNILRKEFGINGICYKRMARGEETAEIFRKETHEKSLMHQHSLTYPIYERFACEEEIGRRVEYIGRKLRSKNLLCKRLFLIERFTNLQFDVAEYKLTQFTNNDRTLYECALELYKNMQHPTAELKVQMFGIMVCELGSDLQSENYDLFNQQKILPYHALDTIKTKYGESSIRVGIGRY
ncbi:MAG: DNA polymerase IV [Bacteroidetes bacterium]|nr:DNA polymerase IV [Bacteroidota bacterium]